MFFSRCNRLVQLRQLSNTTSSLIFSQSVLIHQFKWTLIGFYSSSCHWRIDPINSSPAGSNLGYLEANDLCQWTLENGPYTTDASSSRTSDSPISTLPTAQYWCIARGWLTRYWKWSMVNRLSYSKHPATPSLFVGIFGLIFPRLLCLRLHDLLVEIRSFGELYTASVSSIVSSGNTILIVASFPKDVRVQFENCFLFAS